MYMKVQSFLSLIRGIITGSKNAGAFQCVINSTLSSGEFSKFLAKKMEDVGAHSASGFIDQ